MTHPLLTDDVAVAVRALRAGHLVAIPTETVYGLGADAENPQAVARVYAAKGRPADHPLIVHLASADAIDDGWAVDVPAWARLLGSRVLARARSRSCCAAGRAPATT